MSISALSNNLYSFTSGSSSQLQNSQFRQLGQDLTSGDLSAAQSDFSSLQQMFAQNSGATSRSSSNPIAQAFQQLSSDIDTGNLSAAKQDYSTIQQQLNSGKSASHVHKAASGTEQTTLLQELNQLSQTLSSSSFLSGNASAAQQAYAMPMQLLGSDTSGSGAPASSTGSASDTAISCLA